MRLLVRSQDPRSSLERRTERLAPQRACRHQHVRVVPIRRTLATSAPVRKYRRPSASRPNQTGVGTALPSRLKVTTSAYLCPRRASKLPPLEGCWTASRRRDAGSGRRSGSAGPGVCSRPGASDGHPALAGNPSRSSSYLLVRRPRLGFAVLVTGAKVSGHLVNAVVQLPDRVGLDGQQLLPWLQDPLEQPDDASRPSYTPSSGGARAEVVLPHDVSMQELRCGPRSAREIASLRSRIGPRPRRETALAAQRAETVPRAGLR